MKQARNLNTAIVLATLGLALLGSGCLFTGKKKTQPDLNTSAQPDKILYDRATDDFKHGRYTVARLNLQTLINTYPDSEYLAKAKLAIADSYFKEGGTENLLQAVAEYKDFITFFPFLDEASYAQMQVAMTHYRLMEKPDRDHTEAIAAEQEFQTFLLKYPQSPLIPQAEQHLRDVQENIAEGEFRTADFYYVNGQYRAAAARFIELTSRYPLYSQADRANWILGDIYTRSEKKEVADKYYARLVEDYPLSRYAPEAKQKLVAAGVPVPQPDVYATKRMQYEQEYEAKNRPNILSRTTHQATSILHSGPDLSTAAHAGEPNLEPQGDVVSATNVLRKNTPEPDLAMASTVPQASPAAASGDNSQGASASADSVETVPNASSSVPQAVESNSGPPIVSSPNSGGGSVSGGESTSGGGVGAGGVQLQSVEPSAGGGAVSSPSASGTQSSSPAQASSAAPAAQSGNSQQASADQQTANAKSGQQADKADPKTESTSKKKKGWHKLVPW